VRGGRSALLRLVRTDSAAGVGGRSWIAVVKPGRVSVGGKCSEPPLEVVEKIVAGRLDADA